MKNKIKLYILFALCSMLNLQHAYAQCTPASGYTMTQYNQQISDRLQIADFKLSTINIDLQAGNYIVLNDENFYGGNTGGYGDGCQWSHIDGAYDPTPNINSITYFILTPGDYRDYLTFNPRFGSASSINDKKYLLYYPGSPNDSEQVIENYLNGISETPKAAVEQQEYERAIIENFHLPANSWAWVIRGITIRGNHNSRLDDENFILGTGSSSSQIVSDNNIIESCLFENQVVGNFINITNGDDNIIHNCVIRDQNDCMITYLAGNDIIGVDIKASSSTEAENNTILNNKIYNVTDAIQLTENGNYKGDMPGTFIYGNELYNEKVYTDNCGEERMNGEGAIDIKRGTGSDDVAASVTDKVIIANNLFYGWRRSGTEGLGRVFDGRTKDCVDLATHPADGDCFHDQNGKGGGSGDAISCHINANNIAIINNTVTDCSNGFLISTKGQIEVYNNTICNLYPSHDDYVGETGNGSYWTNTIYNENVWPVNGAGQYEIEPCIQGFGNQYKIGHQVGVAIKCAIESGRISGNTISGTIRGILLEGLGKTALVTDNYINNIHTENFYAPNSCDFANFSGNTYYDFTDICWGGSNSPPSNAIIESNCFLYCNGYAMGANTFSCEADCN